MTTPNMPESSMSLDSSTEQQQPLTNDERFKKGNDKDLQKIRTWAKHEFDAIKNARSAVERQWYLNLAFYFGKQNVVYRQGPNMIVGASGNLYVPPAPYWRSRPVINRIRPIIRQEMTKLTSQKPNVAVVPATNDDRDLFAAQAGEQIWESLYEERKFHHLLRRVTFWSQTCGTGFMKSYWDPDKIDRAANQMGDVCMEPLTPFHLFAPDLRQEEIESQPYLIHAQMKSREQIELQFPGQDFSGSKDQSDILDDSWINLMGASNQTDKKSLMCMEVWVKPGMVKLFPQGAMFTMVGDTIVQGMEGLPYQHGLFPFAKFDHIPSGKFYGDSSIVDLIPLQREYNRTRGQIIEAKNRMAKPQLMAPKGSIDPAKITSEPGQVILYTPGLTPPQPIPLSPLPSYVLQEVDRIIQDMDDISGQHDVSRGQTPAGVTAATAISFLQEQDDSKLSHTYDSLEEGIQKIAQMTLGYVVQFWDVPRMIKTVGTDGAFDVLTLKGSDLNGNTDVRVEAGSALPTSKAARTAWIMDLMKMGFIPPQEGLKLLEMGGVSKLYEAVRRDEKQAQRENTKMAAATQELVDQASAGLEQEMQNNPAKYFDLTTGESKLMTGIDGAPVFPLIVPVNKWDNHEIHIETHNNYRKSAAFDTLDDVQKALFEEHVNQHVEQITVTSMSMPMMPQDPSGDATMDTGQPPMPPMAEAPQMEGV